MYLMRPGKTRARASAWETAGLGKGCVSDRQFIFQLRIEEGRKKREQTQSGLGAWELDTVFVRVSER